MIFSGIQKSSLVDFPGLISCVLFVPGCNYDCFFCHNRSLFDGPHEILNSDKIRDFLHKRVGLLDGVVVTGGEPSLQPDLVETLRKIQGLGYRVKLDTNGSHPEIVEKVLKSGTADYFAIDYKAPAARYQEICGPAADAAKVQESISLLIKSKADFEVRTTVIPQLKQKDLLQMAEELSPVPRWCLNRYRLPEKYRPCDEARVHATPYTQQEVDAFARDMVKRQPHMVLH
jgi:pyruvate formate lyase activating enzyme